MKRIQYYACSLLAVSIITFNVGCSSSNDTKDSDQHKDSSNQSYSKKDNSSQEEMSSDSTQMVKKTPEEVEEDEKMRRDINTKIDKKNNESLKDVVVYVDRRKVTVSGNVKDQKTKDDLMKNINSSNPDSVDDQVTIEANSTPEDKKLKEEIGAAIDSDPQLLRYETVIKVKEGHVLLEGYVNSKFDQQHVADVAENVEGVKSVTNRIIVDGDAIPCCGDDYYR